MRLRSGTTIYYRRTATIGCHRSQPRMMDLYMCLLKPARIHKKTKHKRFGKDTLEVLAVLLDR